MDIIVGVVSDGGTKWTVRTAEKVYGAFTTDEEARDWMDARGSDEEYKLECEGN